MTTAFSSKLDAKFLPIKSNFIRKNHIGKIKVLTFRREVSAIEAIYYAQSSFTEFLIDLN